MTRNIFFPKKFGWISAGLVVLALSTAGYLFYSFNNSNSRKLKHTESSQVSQYNPTQKLSETEKRSQSVSKTLESLTLNQTNFSGSYETKDYLGKRWAPKILGENEEVYIAGEKALANRLYFQNNSEVVLQNNEFIVESKEKIFLAPIIKENENYKMAREKNNQTLTIESNIPYSIPLEKTLDGKVDISEMNFIIQTERWSDKLFYKLENNLNIQVGSQRAQELLILVEDPIEGRKSQSYTRLHFKQQKVENGYILGTINIEGRPHGTFYGEIKPKSIPQVSLPTPKPTPLPGTYPTNQKVLSIKRPSQ